MAPFLANKSPACSLSCEFEVVAPLFFVLPLICFNTDLSAIAILWILFQDHKAQLVQQLSHKVSIFLHWYMLITQHSKKMQPIHLTNY